MDRIPPHDPFDAPDAEDEADTRERVLEGGEDAGDGDAPRVRRELGLDDDDSRSESTWSESSPLTEDLEDRDRRQILAFIEPDGEPPAWPPDLDLHGWESTWASIEQDAEGDPDAALSLYADLVERVVRASGYAIEDPVARQGEEPEVVVTYLAARDVAERAEVGDATRSEVEVATDDLRTVFESLLGEIRPA
jgi:hypothetical protein